MNLASIPCLLFVFASGCSESSFSSSSKDMAKKKEEKKEEPDDDDKKDESSDDDDVDDKAKVEEPVGVLDEEFKCAKGEDGWIGKVYQLNPGQPKLPDFKTMTPLGQVESLELNVPPRDFDDGFPGVPNLVEWFGIAFHAALAVPEDGT